MHNVLYADLVWYIGIMLYWLFYFIFQHLYILCEKTCFHGETHLDLIHLS